MRTAVIVSPGSNRDMAVAPRLLALTSRWFGTKMLHYLMLIWSLYRVVFRLVTTCGSVPLRPSRLFANALSPMSNAAVMRLVFVTDFKFWLKQDFCPGR